MLMLSPDAEMLLAATNGAIRPMKRAEYEHLARQGFFEDEKVELLFGLVVPMAPIDQPHNEGVRRLYNLIHERLKDRAATYPQSSFAATDDSEPQPDVYVAQKSSWTEIPARALLAIEVSNSSLRRDRIKRTIYAHADVDEYWIVNQQDGCVEIYRDAKNGKWTTVSIHRRGESISPLRFPDVAIPVADILPPEATT